MAGPSCSPPAAQVATSRALPLRLWPLSKGGAALGAGGLQCCHPLESESEVSKPRRRKSAL